VPQLSAHPLGSRTINMDIEYIFGLVFIFAGAYAIVQAWLDILKGKRSEDWPKVYGEILATEVSSSSDVYDGVMYYPLVRYRFEYLGAQYESENIKIGSFLTGSIIKSFSRNAIEQYHPKQTVTIYVCPDDPTNSVLKRGISKASYFVIAFGAIIFAIGIKYLLIHF
jgi:hypothetical protein